MAGGVTLAAREARMQTASFLPYLHARGRRPEHGEMSVLALALYASAIRHDAVVASSQQGVAYLQTRRRKRWESWMRWSQLGPVVEGKRPFGDDCVGHLQSEVS